MIGPIEEGWESYRRSVVNPLNSPQQVAEMRRVFFAGAMISFVAVTQAGAEGMTEDQGVEVLKRITADIESFQKELAACG